MFLQGTINYYNINVRANVIEANAFRRKKTSAKTDQTTETLRYPEIGVRVTGSAMFFSFCGDVIDLTR